MKLKGNKMVISIAFAKKPFDHSISGERLEVFGQLGAIQSLEERGRVLFDDVRQSPAENVRNLLPNEVVDLDLNE